MSVCLLLLVCCVAISAQPNTPILLSAQPKTKLIPWVIPCKKMIDKGLFDSIKRRTQEALDNGATYLIFDIDTYGGDLLSAFEISNYFLDEINTKVHTVAYVSKKAISAGAMISVSCKDIIMKERTTIGDCAPIQMGGELKGVEREKIETVTRAAFVNAAEANGYPEALLKSMVTTTIEVYRIKNLKTGEHEFFEGVRLPKDVNEYDLDGKELIVEKDKLLTLTASEAVKYKVARTQVENLKEALAFLEKRDGVEFAEPIVLETNWSEEMVRWINSPAVMSILVTLTLLAIYMELNTPGVGLPGLVALICIVIIIGSKYLTGMANWVEVALFIVGIILLIVEIFILPGFGIAGILGVLCVVTGVFGMLIRNPPEKIPWPETIVDWELFANGVFGLVFGFAGFAVLAWLLTKYMPKLELLSGLILVPASAKQGGAIPVSATAPPETDAVNVKIGDIGEVVSTLRPTGKAEFGEIIVDVVAQAEFLAKGTKVVIMEIHGNRVVVKNEGK